MSEFANGRVFDAWAGLGSRAFDLATCEMPLQMRGWGDFTFVFATVGIPIGLVWMGWVGL